MPGSKDNRAGNGRLRLRVFQVLLLVLLFLIWYVLTSPTLLPPIYFTEANQAAFFFGEPIQVFARLWQWFVSGEIYEHLWVTLVETLLAFLIGTVSGVVIGLWLALTPTASAVLDPYIKAANAMPRVILAPIFAVWFGLGILSKVALGITLVFFIVFFNVYQGVKEVSPVVLSNARMLGATRRDLLRHIYLPSLTSCGHPINSRRCALDRPSAKCSGASPKSPDGECAGSHVRHGWSIRSGRSWRTRRAREHEARCTATLRFVPRHRAASARQRGRTAHRRAPRRGSTRDRPVTLRGEHAPRPGGGLLGSDARARIRRGP